MLAYMKCVAEAVVAKGVRGLVEWVPGGAYLYDVAADAGKRLRDRKHRAEVIDELRQAAQASFEEAKAAAEQVAREVAAAGPVEDRVALELYLSQVPGAVRKSLRRAEDHTGRSVPAGFVLDTPDDLLRTLPPQMPRFRTGQQLPGRPGWTLLEPLGAGGFGEVWKVGHEFIPDVRAVKFCTDPAAKQRLLTHEGKLVARVMKEGRHPNVVPLVDADLSGETPWLAYEFVGGGDLAGLILSWQQLPIEERVKRAVEALRVLADTAAHFHRLSPPIVHRDMKPANILRGTDGKLRITDFGIGGIAAQKLLSGSRDGLTAYTKALSLLSGAYTPLYASPQQQKGDAPDRRDDVHALGVIAFQMLTGRLDAGPGPHFERDLGKLGVPEWLAQLVGDCIDHETENRPATGAALLDRLQATEPVPAPPVRPVMAPTPPTSAPSDEERRKQAEADYQRGLAYSSGRGVPRDHAKARELYERAAALGHAPAHYILGFLYDSGDGVRQDYGKAREWYEKAAALNHPAAQVCLGFLYRRGLGGPKDDGKARELYERAAALNHPAGQVYLGIMYHFGDGVRRDYGKARELYERAAALNDRTAQYGLGCLYEHGLGVPQDRTKALDWYRKAVANGHEDAKKKVAELEGGFFRRLFGG